MKKYLMYIGGNWCNAIDGKEKDVISPVNGELIGQIALGSSKDVNAAVAAAKAAESRLALMSVFDRAVMLKRVANAIDTRSEELSHLLTCEHGKTLKEALGEVKGTAEYFREAAEQIKWMESGTIPAVHSGKRVLSYRRPLGTTAVITPWNFPIGCPGGYYLPYLLAAGDPFIWNPATSTAAVASAFMQCFEDAEVPAGFANLVIGTGREVGTALTIHPDIAAIGFTGSTEAGRAISAGAGLKHTVMELGGNGPCIVMKDADLELAAEELMGGAFSNAGQICTSTERVLADESIADELAGIIRSKMSNYRLGDPFDPTVNVGPMHKAATIDIVKEHIEDALQKGASLLEGGQLRTDMPTHNYMEPTLLDHVSRDSLLNEEETFGPVIPIIRYKNENELPEIIADSDYRLFAAIFTRDITKALQMADRMKFGTININSSTHYWEPDFPAGGGAGSASGYGRSGGKWSIEDFTEIRNITIRV